jgi:hypothetical protein
MGMLDNPMFWVGQESNVGKLQTDGSLKFMLLNSDYSMLPLIRKKDTTFTDFLASDADAKKCKIIVNGNMYGLDKTGAFWVAVGRPDDPSDTLVQGRVVLQGKILAGDSRPQSFWFGQLLAPTPEGSIFVADKGDPPVTPSTIAAIGGVGPLIAGAMTYGIGNLYKPGAPSGVNEPATGQPPAPAMPYLIQRNNETFRDASARPPETGKTIVAYCSQKKMLLVAVQPNGAAPGQTHSALASTLAQRGFDSAVFFDGSDSATLVVDGKLEVTPGARKNDSIDVGIGFYR